MKRPGLIAANWLVCVALAAAFAPAQQPSTGSPSGPAPDRAPDPWSAPAAALASHIAGILGPGPVQFSLTNLSSLSPADVAAVGRLLRGDLQSDGIFFGGPDSASILRVTLSENSRERLWVAEIVEGTVSQVVMVTLPASPTAAAAQPAGLTLRMQTVFTSPDPILSFLQTPNGVVVLEPDKLLIETRAADGAWQIAQRVDLPQSRTLSRDPRGLITPAAGGEGFLAYTGGAACQGTYTPSLTASEWTITCAPSDDPWTLVEPISPGSSSAASLKAFFNAARNFFTGVVTPGFGVDLPPFYSEALLPRAAGDRALLLTAVDGRVLLVESGLLQPIAVARDWGSDIAALRSGCGTGTQLLASGSGQAVNDSLRAYSLPALEAVPASAPLAMDGAIIALFSTPDGVSALAIVRTTDSHYEVDRVSALCN